MSDYNEHLISLAGGDGDRLAVIQHRVDNATRGPWDIDAGDGVIYSTGFHDDPMFLFTPHEDHVDGFGVPGEDCTDDAEFIANARTDVPYLLALAKDQQAKLDRIIELAHWAGKRGWTLHPAEIRVALEARA